MKPCVEKAKPNSKGVFHIKAIRGGSELKVIIFKVPDFFLTVVWFGFFHQQWLFPALSVSLNKNLDNEQSFFAVDFLIF